MSGDSNAKRKTMTQDLISYSGERYLQPGDRSRSKLIDQLSARTNRHILVSRSETVRVVKGVVSMYVTGSQHARICRHDGRNADVYFGFASVLNIRVNGGQCYGLAVYGRRAVDTPELHRHVLAGVVTSRVVDLRRNEFGSNSGRAGMGHVHLENMVIRRDDKLVLLRLEQRVDGVNELRRICHRHLVG